MAFMHLTSLWSPGPAFHSQLREEPSGFLFRLYVKDFGLHMQESSSEQRFPHRTSTDVFETRCQIPNSTSLNLLYPTPLTPHL